MYTLLHHKFLVHDSHWRSYAKYLSNVHLQSHSNPRQPDHISLYIRLTTLKSPKLCEQQQEANGPDRSHEKPVQRGCFLLSLVEVAQ